MALKTFKPYTKSTRGTVVLDKSKLWKGSPYKPLTKGQNFTGGRNNNGRITSRHIGGGSKHKYRIIDFYRKKKNIPATVERIEYDPNRTAHIALIAYKDLYSDRANASLQRNEARISERTAQPDPVLNRLLAETMCLDDEAYNGNKSRWSKQLRGVAPLANPKRYCHNDRYAN